MYFPPILTLPDTIYLSRILSYNPFFIAHIIVNYVHENNCVKFFQVSFLSFLYNKKDLVCDPDDGIIENLGIIQFKYMTFDIIRDNSFGIHKDDLFFPA